MFGVVEYVVDAEETMAFVLPVDGAIACACTLCRA